MQITTVNHAPRKSYETIQANTVAQAHWNIES